MLQVSGYWLMVTSIIHIVVHVLLYIEPLSDIVRSGIFNAVDPYFDRGTAFWVLVLSPFIFALGQLCCWAQARRVRLPAFLGWNVLITSGVGAFLMPISGFWFLMPPAILMILASQQKESQPANVTDSV